MKPAPIHDSIKRARDALTALQTELVFLCDLLDRVGGCVWEGCKEPAAQPACVPFCKKHFVEVFKEHLKQ
jgi:hypothetical protein